MHLLVKDMMCMINKKYSGNLFAYSAAGQRYNWLFGPQGQNPRSEYLRDLLYRRKLLCKDTNAGLITQGVESQTYYKIKY